MTYPQWLLVSTWSKNYLNFMQTLLSIPYDISTLSVLHLCLCEGPVLTYPQCIWLFSRSFKLSLNSTTYFILSHLNCQTKISHHLWEDPVLTYTQRQNYLNLTSEMSHDYQHLLATITSLNFVHVLYYYSHHDLHLNSKSSGILWTLLYINLYTSGFVPNTQSEMHTSIIKTKMRATCEAGRPYCNAKSKSMDCSPKSFNILYGSTNTSPRVKTNVSNHKSTLPWYALSWLLQADNDDDLIGDYVRLDSASPLRRARVLPRTMCHL